MSLSYFNQFQPNPNQNQMRAQTQNQDQSFLTFPPTQFQLPSNSQYLSNNLTISESFNDPILPIESSYQYYDQTSPLFTPSDSYNNISSYLNTTNSPSYYLNNDNNNNYFYEPSSPSFPNQVYPKRQRFCYEEDYYQPIGPMGCSFIPNPPVFFPEFVEEEGSSSAVVVAGNDDDNKKKKNCVENVSAQSIAARQRRRKISEKTQELGKLIPGGQRMNTAEMFHAAFKHIKFLQAQVGILELMASFYHHNHHLELEDEEEEEEWVRKEMAVAVTCPKIQEKLHWKEKCLVPKQILKRLLNDPQLNSNVALLLDEFILSLPC